MKKLALFILLSIASVANAKTYSFHDSFEVPKKFPKTANECKNAFEHSNKILNASLDYAQEQYLQDDPMKLAKYAEIAADIKINLFHWRDDCIKHAK